RRDGLERLFEEHRARPRAPRHLERLLPLHPRSRRPSPRALHKRLFHHGPRSFADALVAERPPSADIVGRAGAALLVRRGIAVCRPKSPRSPVRRRRHGRGLGMRTLRTLAIALGLIFSGMHMATANELNIIVGGSLSALFGELGPQFEKASG